MSGDLRDVVRQLRAHPTYTVVTVVTLALGIGLNTAMFSLVSAVLLEPLPYPNPDELVLLRVQDSNGRLGDASLQDYEDWRRDTRAFVSMGAYAVRGGNLGGGAEPIKIQHALVTPSLLATVGVTPAAGRLFDAGENEPGRDAVALISDSLWRGAFGGHAGIVGTSVDLNGTRLRIIGVMPPRFRFPDETVALWKPFGMAPDDGGARDGRWVRVVARRRTHVSSADASTDFNRIVEDLGRRHPETNARLAGRVIPLLESIVGSTRTALLLLSAAVAVVLVIACVNVANLIAARTGGRERSDIAIRLALGASRWRVARLVVLESAVLAAAGASAGVAAGVWAAGFLPRLSAGSLPRAEEVALDWRVLAFSAVLTCAAAIATAWLPAAKAGRSDPARALRTTTRGVAGRSRLRRVLVIVEVGLAFAAVIVAGLVARSFARANAVDPGFTPAGVLTLRIEPAWRATPERAASREQFEREHAADRLAAAAFYRTLLERVRAVPGVVHAAAVNRRPFSGSWWSTDFRLESRAGLEASTPRGVLRVVTGGFFEAMRIPLLAGRTLRSADTGHAPRVVVVSAGLARSAWPGRSAIGQRLSIDASPVYEVVGVVGDVKPGRPDDQNQATAYFSFDQAPWGHFGDWGMDLVVRAAGDELQMVASVREAVRTAAPDLPIVGLMRMTDAFGLGLADRRFHALMFGAFGALSLALAMTGLGGVLVMLVGERRTEIGIRAALGATPRHILSSVLRESLALTASGLLAGLAAALLTSRVIASFLFGISATDPSTYAGAAMLVAVVSLTASLVPLARALAVNPVEALRR
jgi:predicted permease